MVVVLLVSLALIGLLAALAMPWTSAHLQRCLETDPPLAEPADLRGVQAIVVLGSDFVGYAPELGGDTVGAMTLQRLHYAARLHRQTGLPLLVTGGEIGRGGRTLATCMAEVLQRDFDVPVRWLEHRARNTRENVLFSAALLRGAGIGHVCVVTHGFHMHRARRGFARCGFEVVAAPTLCRHRPTPLPRDFKPDSGSLYRSSMAVREWVSRLSDAWRNISPSASSDRREP